MTRIFLIMIGGLYKAQFVRADGIMEMLWSERDAQTNHVVKTNSQHVIHHAEDLILL
jgi:hypothetical protein